MKKKMNEYFKEKKIIRADELPQDEKLYLKKDMFGYRIVHPIKNEDGSINWWNLLFGGKRFFVGSLIALIILGLIGLSYQHDLDEYRAVVESPCDYCADKTVVIEGGSNSFPKLNISNINITNAEG